MAHQTIPQLDSLRRRVEDLGRNLVTAAGLLEADGVTKYTGLFVVNPETHSIEIYTAGSDRDDFAEVAAWCAKREGRARVLADADGNGAGARLLPADDELRAACLELAAEKHDQTAPRQLDDNDRVQVAAFLNHMTWLSGCQQSETAERGKLVVQRLAMGRGPIHLTLEQCADVTDYLGSIEPADGSGALHWYEGERDGGDMTTGLMLILRAVEDRLRADTKIVEGIEPRGNAIAELGQLFQGIEASAKLLSLHVDTTDLDTDLVAACMTIAREAERGYMLVGEIMKVAR